MVLANLKGSQIEGDYKASLKLERVSETLNFSEGSVSRLSPLGGC